jgi:cytochrome P450
MADQAIGELATVIGTRAACSSLGRARASYYRHHRRSPPPPRPRRARAPQPRALSPSEQAQVLSVLHDERFVDQAPASVYAELLDEGRYLCSVPTMYRLLRAEGEVHERRRQATHPATVKPELIAVQPNAVWTWDITKLRVFWRFRGSGQARWRPGKGGHRPARVSSESAMSAWAERNPNARRAINRTLVLSDSTRPLLTPCSSVASISAR